MSVKIKGLRKRARTDLARSIEGDFQGQAFRISYDKTAERPKQIAWEVSEVSGLTKTLGDAEQEIIKVVSGVVSAEPVVTDESSPVAQTVEDVAPVVLDRLPGVSGRLRTRPKSISGVVSGLSFAITYDKKNKTVVWNVGSHTGTAATVGVAEEAILDVLKIRDELFSEPTAVEEAEATGVVSVAGDDELSSVVAELFALSKRVSEIAHRLSAVRSGL